MMTNLIGTLSEQPLHAGLKEYYANGGGRLEVKIEGYFIDVMNEHELIEIQTKNFYIIRQKLLTLLKKFDVKLVYPVASEKWLLKLSAQNDGETIRRKSPKIGNPCQVFNELVSFPELIYHPKFTLDIAMVDIEEVRHYTVEKAWRHKGWRTVEQRLIQVVNIIQIKHPADLFSLFPETLPDRFTTENLQNSAQVPHRLAQKAVYCLKKAAAVELIGKSGRFNLYERVRDDVNIEKVVEIAQL